MLLGLCLAIVVLTLLYCTTRMSLVRLEIAFTKFKKETEAKERRRKNLENEIRILNKTW